MLAIVSFVDNGIVLASVMKKLLKKSADQLTEVHAIGSQLQVPLQHIIKGAAVDGSKISASSIGRLNDNGLCAFRDGGRNDCHSLGGSKGKDSERESELHDDLWGM